MLRLVNLAVTDISPQSPGKVTQFRDAVMRQAYAAGNPIVYFETEMSPPVPPGTIVIDSLDPQCGGDKDEDEEDEDEDDDADDEEEDSDDDSDDEEEDEFEDDFDEEEEPDEDEEEEE